MPFIREHACYLLGRYAIPSGDETTYFTIRIHRENCGFDENEEENLIIHNLVFASTDECEYGDGMWIFYDFDYRDEWVALKQNDINTEHHECE